jgi:hypothetical protein
MKIEVGSRVRVKTLEELYKLKDGFVDFTLDEAKYIYNMGITPDRMYYLLKDPPVFTDEMIFTCGKYGEVKEIKTKTRILVHFMHLGSWWEYDISWLEVFSTDKNGNYLLF